MGLRARERRGHYNAWTIQSSSPTASSLSRNLQPSAGGSAAIVHVCSSHAPLPPVPIVCATCPHQGVASKCLVCLPGRASPLRSPFLRRSVTRAVFARIPTRSGWKDALPVNRGNCSCSLWLSWQLRQMLRAQLSRVSASHGSPLLPGVVTWALSACHPSPVRGAEDLPVGLSCLEPAHPIPQFTLRVGSPCCHCPWMEWQVILQVPRHLASVVCQNNSKGFL